MVEHGCHPSAGVEAFDGRKRRTATASHRTAGTVATFDRRISPLIIAAARLNPGVEGINTMQMIAAALTSSLLAVDRKYERLKLSHLADPSAHLESCNGAA